MRCRTCQPLPEEVARAAELLGRRWVLAILWASAEAGAVRFNEFKQTLEGIPPRTLAARLLELEQAGVLERRVLAPRLREADPEAAALLFTSTCFMRAAQRQIMGKANAPLPSLERSVAVFERLLRQGARGHTRRRCGQRPAQVAQDVVQVRELLLEVALVLLQPGKPLFAAGEAAVAETEAAAPSGMSASMVHVLTSLPRTGRENFRSCLAPAPALPPPPLGEAGAPAC